MTTSLTSRSAVLRVDAVFEVLLAVACVVLAGRLVGTGDWRVPSWLAPPVLVAVAVVLVAAGAVLWWLSARADAAALRSVAIANAVTAMAFLFWALLGLDQELRVVVVGTAVVLGVLAGTQLALARR